MTGVLIDFTCSCVGSAAVMSVGNFIFSGSLRLFYFLPPFLPAVAGVLIDFLRVPVSAISGGGFVLCL